VTSTLAYNVDTKVWYTLATKLNSTRSVDFVESRLLPKVATNRQQSQLLPYTVDFVADTVNFVADTVNFVADTVNFVADTVNFVASVDGAKLHSRSTFNKVDRVEFNLVASVYQA